MPLSQGLCLSAALAQQSAIGNSDQHGINSHFESKLMPSVNTASRAEPLTTSHKADSVSLWEQRISKPAAGVQQLLFCIF